MSVYDLTGRKALVTGGARGLGEGMARALARAGAAVVIGDIREDLGKATAEALRQDGASAEFVPLDVTADDELGAGHPAGHRAPRRPGHPGQQRRGGDHQPAGGHRPGRRPADARGERARHRAGPQARLPGDAARAARPAQGGAIVNVASVAATIAFPGIAGYSATKSAVDRLTKVAAMESGRLGYGVRVNCVYPGLVPTEMGKQLAGGLRHARAVPERRRRRRARWSG